MTKLQLLLREYENVRWMKTPTEQRFLFETEQARFSFILKLNEVNAEYYLYDGNKWKGEVSSYKIDVFVG